MSQMTKLLREEPITDMWGLRMEVSVMLEDMDRLRLELEQAEAWRDMYLKQRDAAMESFKEAVRTVGEIQQKLEKLGE